MARLYYVYKPNPIVRKGIWMERFDDGFQEVVVESPEGRLEVMRTKGLVYPAEIVEEFLLPAGTAYRAEELRRFTR